MNFIKADVDGVITPKLIIKSLLEKNCLFGIELIKFWGVKLEC